KHDLLSNSTNCTAAKESILIPLNVLPKVSYLQLKEWAKDNINVFNCTIQDIPMINLTGLPIPVLSSNLASAVFSAEDFKEILVCELSTQLSSPNLNNSSVNSYNPLKQALIAAYTKYFISRNPLFLVLLVWEKGQGLKTLQELTQSTQLYHLFNR